MLSKSINTESLLNINICTAQAVGADADVALTYNTTIDDTQEKNLLDQRDYVGFLIKSATNNIPSGSTIKINYYGSDKIAFIGSETITLPEITKDLVPATEYYFYSVYSKLANYFTLEITLKKGTAYTATIDCVVKKKIGDVDMTDPELLAALLTKANLSGAVFTGSIAKGTTSPATDLHIATNSTSSPRGIMSSQHSTGVDGARFHGRKSRGTNAVPTIIVTGDMLTRLVGSGYDGTSYLEMASIDFIAAGTIATNRIPTDIIFNVATDAATSVLTERMRLNRLGRLGIGITSPTNILYNLQVNGSIAVSNASGSDQFFVMNSSGALQKIEGTYLMEVKSTTDNVKLSPASGKTVNISVDPPSYADNAAAVAAGLAVGTIYRTGDLLKIVHA